MPRGESRNSTQSSDPCRHVSPAYVNRFYIGTYNTEPNRPLHLSENHRRHRRM